MKEYTFTIDEALRDAIELRQYELNALERLIVFSLATQEYQVPNDKIELLKQDYIEKNAEYNILKQKITDMISKDYDLNRTSWNLDFNKCEVHVTEQ